MSAIGAGSSTITARQGSVSATAQITVTDPNASAQSYGGGGGGGYGGGSGSSSDSGGGGGGGGFDGGGGTELQPESGGGANFEDAYSDDGLSTGLDDASVDTDPEAAALAEAQQIEETVMGIATLPAAAVPSPPPIEEPAIKEGDRVRLDGRYGKVIPNPSPSYFGEIPGMVWVRWDDDRWFTDAKECVDMQLLEKVPHIPGFGGGIDIVGNKGKKMTSTLIGLDVFCGSSNDTYEAGAYKDGRRYYAESPNASGTTSGRSIIASKMAPWAGW